MKTTILARVGAVVLGVVILALFQVTTSYATKWDNDGYQASVVTPCAENASFFPSSLYTKIDTSKNGSFSGFEIHTSNQDGKCSALLYSSIASASDLNSSNRQNDDDLFIIGR